MFELTGYVIHVSISRGLSARNSPDPSLSLPFCPSSACLLLSSRRLNYLGAPHPPEAPAGILAPPRFCVVAFNVQTFQPSNVASTSVPRIRSGELRQKRAGFLSLPRVTGHRSRATKPFKINTCRHLSNHSKHSNFKFFRMRTYTNCIYKSLTINTYKGNNILD